MVMWSFHVFQCILLLENHTIVLLSCFIANVIKRRWQETLVNAGQVYISTMTTCYFKLPKVHLRLCCQFEISSLFLGLQYVTPLGRAFTAFLTIWNLYKFLDNLEFIVSKLLRWLLTTPAIINKTCYSNFKIQN